MDVLRRVGVPTSLLRLVGLAVAAIVLMAGAQLLLLSFETDPILDQDLIEDLTGWIGRRPLVGVGLLVGFALIACSIGLIAAMVRSLGPDRRVITTRRREGWTRLDRATLADAIERHLETIDRRSDITARVRQDGRVDLALTTPDPSSMGPARELRTALDEFCEARALPCRSGRVTASAPRRASGRRRVR